MERIRLAVCVSFLAVSGAWAVEQDASGPGKAPPVNEVATKPLVQTTCPVMGEPVKKDVVTDFEGGKVYFCCPGCIAKFNKDPNKYLPALYKQIYPQDGQTHCPVTGKAVDSQVKTEYEGKTVRFSDKEARGCGSDGKGCDHGGKASAQEENASSQGKKSCDNGKDGCGNCRDDDSRCKGGCSHGNDGCGRDKKCSKGTGKETSGCCEKAAASHSQ